MKNMNITTIKLSFALATLSVASAANAADEITTWNEALIQATLTAATPAPLSPRVGAIVQSAVFDAVNGIDRRYSPVHVHASGPRGASERAAAVQAAYATLVSLFPAQKAGLDQLRTDSLAAILEPSYAIEQGIAWGQSVADQILAWRSHDGFSDTQAPYLGGTQPGQWRPTPPAMAPGLAPQIASMTPWMISTPSQFRAPGPPALDSDQYTADYNEVKNMGAAAASTRTADQTLYVKFWAATNPLAYWDPVVRSLAARHRYSRGETARLLAQVNIAMADGVIGCWDSKYTYSFWRPVTAISLGDADGNDQTAADPAWTPLIVTPAFPEYPSAHSCISGAVLQVLANTFGEQTKFDVVIAAMPGVTRSFSSFIAALDEIGNARVLGGIHFRTATVDGAALGISVGNFVFLHAARPDHDDEDRDEKEH